MKLCNSCNQTKEFNQFWKDVSFKDGYKSTCLQCCAVKRKKRYNKIQN